MRARRGGHDAAAVAQGNAVTLLQQRLLALGGVLLTGIVVMHASAPTEQLPPREPLSSMPATLAGWRSAGDVAIDEGSLKVLNADDYVSRSYVSGARDVE